VDQVGPGGDGCQEPEKGRHGHAEGEAEPS
jgi:hypothetical protein